MADPIIPPPPGYVPQPINEGVQSLANVIGRLIAMPRRAMEQGVTTEEAIPWAADTALTAAGTAAGGAVPGAAGIFGGKLAATADHDLLRVAEEMSRRNLPREQIWDATGWFQGFDGKWRFEIPDHNLQIRHGSSMGLDAPTARHPELNSAYGKQLGDMAINFRPDTGKPWGLYHPRDGILSPIIEVEATNPNTLRVGAVHELQHAVQDAEGFAMGGSPEWIRPRIPLRFQQALTPAQLDKVADQAYRNLAGEVEARNVQSRLHFTPEERRNVYPWATEDRPQSVQWTMGYGSGPQAATKDTLEGVQGRMSFFDSLPPEVRQAIAGAGTDVKMEPWMKSGNSVDNARLIRFNDETNQMSNYLKRGMADMLNIFQRTKK